MLDSYEQYASMNNIQFSTHLDSAKSKSKALYMIGNNADSTKPAPLVLCGKQCLLLSRNSGFFPEFGIFKNLSRIHPEIRDNIRI